MTYLKRHSALKEDPSNLLDGVKTVLCFGALYNSSLPYSIYDKENRPGISRYALNYDYHDILRKKLYALIDEVKKEFEIDFSYRVCVDSAPILERSYSVDAGLGWIGKNGNLINPDIGSFFFLSEILTDIDFEPNKNIIKDKCGKCKLCMEACPTGAITSERVIDSSKCLSYLTIENKKEIPEEFKNKTKGFVFGCDICQEVCPWNKKAPITRIEEFKPRDEILELSWEQCRNLTGEDFQRIFKKNPVKRTKYKGFMRNVRFNLE